MPTPFIQASKLRTLRRAPQVPWAGAARTGDSLGFFGMQEEPALMLGSVKTVGFMVILTRRKSPVCPRRSSCSGRAAADGRPLEDLLVSPALTDYSATAIETRSGRPRIGLFRWWLADGNSRFAAPPKWSVQPGSGNDVCPAAARRRYERAPVEVSWIGGSPFIPSDWRRDGGRRQRSGSRPRTILRPFSARDRREMACRFRTAKYFGRLRSHVPCPSRCSLDPGSRQSAST